MKPITRTDSVTERAARWLAARTTRRSFIGNVGKVGLVAAGGSVIATVLTERAEARVCGQSGVSPKCPTYDCFPPSVWGWCWYAGNASCCADGGLKKICDCCLANHPNVHGYCPDGTNVFCIVESCLEDPRVMKVPVSPLPGQSATQVSVQRTSGLAAGSVNTVVLADATDRFAASLAIPVAARLGAAMLSSDGTSLDPLLVAELARLGAKRIVAVGPNFTAGLLGAINSLPGINSIGHLGTNPSLPVASVEIAQWLTAEGMPTNYVVVGFTGLGIQLAPAAASVAALSSAALLLGADAAGAIAGLQPGAAITWVGDVAGQGRSGDATVGGTDPLVVSRDLAARRLAAEPAASFALALVVSDDSAHSVPVVQPGSIAIVHGPDTVEPAMRDWLIANRARFSSATMATGARGGMTNQRVYDTQGAVNGFLPHLLTGTDGMGLPVIPQPVEEMAQGKARVTGPAPSTTRPLAKRTRATTTTKKGKGGSATTLPKTPVASSTPGSTPSAPSSQAGTASATTTSATTTVPTASFPTSTASTPSTTVAPSP
jgi:hypothetical protein